MRMMTVKDIAELCQVHKLTVYRWVKSGKIPKPKMIGRKMLWSYGEIIDAMSKE
jgi:excisionase family DNA binding protein